MFRMVDEPPGARKFQTLLRDIAVRAFDFPRADRKSFGEGLAIIQLVFTGAEISMADADRGLIVAHIETFKVEKQGFQMQKYGLHLTVRSAVVVGVRRAEMSDHAACSNFSLATGSMSMKVCIGVLPKHHLP